MSRRSRVSHFLLPTTLAVVAAATAPAQGDDPLAPAKAAAAAENQRVLVCLSGENDPLSDALAAAMKDYRQLGKLLRYEYQVVTAVSGSGEGKILAAKLPDGSQTAARPTLAVLTATGDHVATLSGDAMKDKLIEVVRAFLDEHKAAPLHAEKVLAAGLETAKRSNRHAFVYLSAPW